MTSSLRIWTAKDGEYFNLWSAAHAWLVRPLFLGVLAATFWIEMEACSNTSWHT